MLNIFLFATDAMLLLVMVLALFFIIRFIEFLDKTNCIFYVHKAKCKKCHQRLTLVKLCSHVGLNERFSSWTPVVFAIIVGLMLLSFDKPTEAEIQQSLYEIHWFDCDELYDKFHSYEIGSRTAKQIYIIKRCDPAYDKYLQEWAPPFYKPSDFMDDPPEQTHSSYREYPTLYSTVIKPILDWG